MAGELLRLLAGHPDLEAVAILSDSQPGTLVAGAFAHLRSAYPELKFSGVDDLDALLRRTPVVCLVFGGAARRIRGPSSIVC